MNFTKLNITLAGFLWRSWSCILIIDENLVFVIVVNNKLVLTVLPENIMEVHQNSQDINSQEQWLFSEKVSEDPNQYMFLSFSWIHVLDWLTFLRPKHNTMTIWMAYFPILPNYLKTQTIAHYVL